MKSIFSLLFLSVSLSFTLSAQSGQTEVIFHNFSCHLENGKYSVCWSQDLNTSVDQIRIQRATANMVFETVEEILPMNNNGTYLIELPPVPCQDYYYRLEADVQGEQFRSEVVFVACQLDEEATAFELRRNIDAHRVILVKNALQETSDAHYRIYNLQGDLVAQQNLPPVFQQAEVDISGFPTGNYLLRVHHGMNVSSPLRFIKVD